MAADPRRAAPRKRNPSRRAWQRVDNLDHAILRELARDKVLLWGGLDPRVSAAQLAEAVGVDRSTVRARLRAWEKVGFLGRFHVVPNPRIWGHNIAAGGVMVADPKDKARVLDDLALVDGVIAAQEHVGGWIGIGFVDEGPVALERRLRLLARLPGVAEVQPPLRWNAPAAKRDPTPLDWRIMRALRAEGPAAPLGDLARAVGVSPNTFHAHYEAMVKGNVLWSLPDLDFTRYEGAVVARMILTLSPEGARDVVVRGLRTLVHDPILETTAPEVRDEQGRRLLSLVVQTASVGAAEEAEIAARGLPGVAEVETLFLRRWRVFSAWADEQVARMASGVGPEAARRPRTKRRA